jgi:hypothetical protein
MFFFAAAPIVKGDESVALNIKRRIAGIKAQELLLAEEYHHIPLKTKTFKDAFAECAKIAEATYDPKTEKGQIATEQRKIYNRLATSVAKDLKDNEELLKALRTHILQYGAINAQAFFAIRNQYANGPQHKSSGTPAPISLAMGQRKKLQNPPEVVRLASGQAAQQPQKTAAAA